MTVWADDSRLAQRIAGLGLNGQLFNRCPMQSHEPKEIGAEPDPEDIGIAPSYAAVNHERVSADGAPESTLHRPSFDELQRLTALMRQYKFEEDA